MGNKVMFLDYDGVVNTPMWDKEGKKCTYNFPTHNTVNNFQAVQWISEACQKYGFDIVVTSTWRLDDNYKECLINGGLRSGINIIGRTDYLYTSNNHASRGDEIKKWLDDHPDVDKYIIVDDDKDFLKDQMKFLVRTRFDVGFCLGDFEKLEEILKKEGWLS